MTGPDGSLGDLPLQSDDAGNDTFLPDCAALVAHEVGCSFAGIRLLVERASAQKVLRTIVLYDRSQGPTSAARPDLVDAGIDVYLNTVARHGGLFTSDAASDLRVPKSLRTLLAAQGVNSLLEAALSLNGLVYGTLSCEQTGQNAVWTPHQVDTLRRVAIRVAPTIVRVARSELAASGVGMWPAALASAQTGSCQVPQGRSDGQPA